MTMHDDDKFDAFLAREARAYHEPPADVPRDAMWAAVAASRAARRGAVSAEPTLAPRPPRRLRAAPWIGMAATLLLGVGLGRTVLQERTPSVRPVTQGAAPVEDLPGAGAAVTAPADAGSAGAAVRYAGDGARTRTARATPRPAVLAASPAPAPLRPSAESPAYVIASSQHLSRAEALVAVVASMPSDAAMDSLTARWAKDMLTNTRLLLDSPAGDDPVRRRLLEDLETVLVQLVQRSGRSAEDREILDRTLQRTQLLTRLRSGASGT